MTLSVCIVSLYTVFRGLGAHFHHHDEVAALDPLELVLSPAFS